MNQREQYTISLNKEEAQRIKAVAKDYGETMSGFIRRQIMLVVQDEEEQK